MKRLFLLLFAGLILRLVISSFGYHIDLFSMVDWGKWMYLHGPYGFYDNSIVWLFSTVTQPPLINLLYGFNLYLYDRILWLLANAGVFIAIHHLGAGHLRWFFDFSGWYGNVFYTFSTFKYGELLTFKLVPMLADLSIAAALYLLVKEKTKGLMAAGLFLFFPFSWYLSALWGQYDQTSVLFLVLSFAVLLNKRWSFLSIPLFAISNDLKPSGLIFILLFIYCLYLAKLGFKRFFLGTLVTIILILSTTMPFTHRNLLDFANGELYPKIFEKSEYRVANTALNFWLAVFGTKPENQDVLFIFMPAKYWAYLTVLLVNILALTIVRKKFQENIFLAMFIVGMGSWLFLTNMNERYGLAGIVSLLFFCAIQNKYYRYWLILAALFSINLYYSWLFPGEELTKPLFQWRGALLVRLLSLANVILFFRLIYLFWKDLHISLSKSLSVSRLFTK